MLASWLLRWKRAHLGLRCAILATYLHASTTSSKQTTLTASKPSKLLKLSYSSSRCSLGNDPTTLFMKRPPEASSGPATASAFSLYKPARCNSPDVTAAAQTLVDAAHLGVQREPTCNFADGSRKVRVVELHCKASFRSGSIDKQQPRNRSEAH